jgi:hypothetical protein
MRRRAPQPDHHERGAQPLKPCVPRALSPKLTTELHHRIAKYALYGFRFGSPGPAQTLFEQLRKNRDDRPGRDFAACVAAHAVGNDEKTPLRRYEIAILVRAAHPACVRRDSRPD